MKEKIITAIDLGSSKTCAVIASLQENNKLAVKGIGVCDSIGIDSGLVRDLQATAESIKKAVEIAEEQAGIQADNLVTAISGQHILGKNAIGRVSVANGSQASEIEQNHIDSVINDAKNSIKMQAGTEHLEILHCIPQVFDIDSQKGILNPIGMTGFSMTVHTYLILAEANHLRNIRKAFEMAGFDEPVIVLGSIATAEAVTNEDEKRLGCIVLDIGGGTSDITIFQNACLMMNICVPKGGKLLTKDLAIGLRTPPKFAEELKLEYGNAMASTVDPAATVLIEGIGGRSSVTKSLSLIAEISQIRTKDILETCYKSILAEFPYLDTLTAGMIITGGTAAIKNINFQVEDVFNLPCKIGIPSLSRFTGAVSHLELPEYSSVIGLLYYAIKNERLSVKKHQSFDYSNTLNNIFKSIKKFITDL